MNNIDPDVLAVLQAMDKTPERRRQKAVRAKHQKQSVDQLETQLELLVDEVSRAMPRSHPHFANVVIAVMLKKLARHEEPEYKSALEDGVPPGF
jgi:hypothetical protein